MPELRLACSDHSFPLLSHVQAIRLAAMLGFAGLDIGVIGGSKQVGPEKLRGGAKEIARELSGEVEEAGLIVSDVLLVPSLDFSELAPNHPETGERAQSRRLFTDAAEFAARVGSPGLTILPGVSWSGVPDAESFKRAADELQWRVEAARARDLACSFEANMGSIAQTPEAAADLLAAVPGLELTLDYSHFAAQGIDQSRVDPLIACARHVHARGARSGRLQCATSESTIDYRRIAAALTQREYAGFVATEYVWLEYEGMNDCDILSETVLLRDVLEAAAPARVA